MTSGFGAGVWHCVAAVSDNNAGTTTVYLDGVVAGQANACPGTVLPYYFSIGDYVCNFPNIPSPFAGSIDEVAAFDYALSATDIQNLYAAAGPQPYLNLVRPSTNSWLAWPQGTLLQASSLKGPWTTNSACSPLLLAPSGPSQFYRVQVQ